MNFGLPGLKFAGISENDLEQIAVTTETKNNPVKLTTRDLSEILQRRYNGIEYTEVHT